MSKLLWLFVFALCCGKAWGNAVICYDEDNSFEVLSPKGWQTQYSNGSGPCAFFFPKGYTWDNSPVVMYPNFVRTNEGLESFIEGDLESFEKKRPAIKIEKLAVLKTRNDLTFARRRISNGPSPNEYELIAYLKTSKSVLIAVLSARTANDLQKNEPIFATFLNEILQRSRKMLFSDLKRNADQEKTLPGGADFEIKYIRVMSPYFFQAFQKCAKSAKNGFDAVFQVDIKGVIVSWVNKEDNESGRCAKQEFDHFQGPVPPFEPFHINLDLKMKP